MNTPRTLHTLTRFAGGFLLACGGLDADGNVLATAELYNPAAGTWTTLSAELNTPRYGHAAVATANSALLLIGGQGNRRCVPGERREFSCRARIRRLQGRLRRPQTGFQARVQIWPRSCLPDGDYSDKRRR